jgi:UDP-glucose 4-epimerase
MLLPTDKFIFPSSGKVYGEGENLTEDQLPHPKNNLGKVKLALENILSYRQGVNVILRIFNVYGKGQNDNFLIPTILRQAESGNAILLGDVKSGRDYVYIDDVCLAFEQAIKTNFTEGNHIFNISTGLSTTTKTIVDIIGKKINKNLQVVVEKSKLRLDEHSDEYGNNKKASLDLDWKVSYSIDQGIEKLIKF